VRAQGTGPALRSVAATGSVILLLAGAFALGRLSRQLLGASVSRGDEAVPEAAVGPSSGLADTAEPGPGVEAGLDWVELPGGLFEMGSAAGGADVQPVHQVALPNFALTRSEVTRAQYQACVSDGVCEPSEREPVEGEGPAGPSPSDHPMSYVTWGQARAFCHWAGGRLPSEAEWEYAARGAGRDLPYPWGEEPPSCERVQMRKDGAGCGTGQTAPVCSRAAGHSAQGLCDMLGNVWEWVEDYHRPGYGLAPVDGRAQREPGSGFRVLRGGSLDDKPAQLTVTTRRARDPMDAKRRNGFRCAR
jgi:formylglycine-generating enzyme required for sulfatase activity